MRIVDSPAEVDSPGSTGANGELDMLTLLLVMVIVGALIVLVLWVLSATSPIERSDIRVTNRAAHEHPAPGEASALTPVGPPVAGSRDDRRRHGKL